MGRQKEGPLSPLMVLLFNICPSDAAFTLIEVMVLPTAVRTDKIYFRSTSILLDTLLSRLYRVNESAGLALRFWEGSDYHATARRSLSICSPPMPCMYLASPLEQPRVLNGT